MPLEAGLAPCKPLELYSCIHTSYLIHTCILIPSYKLVGGDNGSSKTKKQDREDRMKKKIGHGSPCSAPRPVARSRLTAHAAHGSWGAVRRPAPYPGPLHTSQPAARARDAAAPVAVAPHAYVLRLEIDDGCMPTI